jgi:hypothetical protein
MKNERLDGVLLRNRKNLVVDVVAAAIFPIALLLSGLAVGHALPKLGAPAPVAAVASMSDSAPT